MILTPPNPTNYCIVCNEVARRTDLSARAKGIYYYIATLPANWKLTQQECMEHFTEGREAFKTAFKELIDTGYVIASKSKQVNGMLSGWDYEVLWTSNAENRHTEKPYIGYENKEICSQTISCVLRETDAPKNRHPKNRQSENPSLLSTDNTNYLLEEVIKEDISNDISKKKSTKFYPPTVEEVIFEFESLGRLKANAEKFFNHYEATDWHSGRAKIKNWKSAIKNWRDELPSYNKNTETEKPKLEYQKKGQSYNGLL